MQHAADEGSVQGVVQGCRAVTDIKVVAGCNSGTSGRLAAMVRGPRKTVRPSGRALSDGYRDNKAACAGAYRSHWSSNGRRLTQEPGWTLTHDPTQCAAQGSPSIQLGWALWPGSLTVLSLPRPRPRSCRAAACCHPCNQNPRCRILGGAQPLVKEPSRNVGIGWRCAARSYRPSCPWASARGLWRPRGPNPGRVGQSSSRRSRAGPSNPSAAWAQVSGSIGL